MAKDSAARMTLIAGLMWLVFGVCMASTAHAQFEPAEAPPDSIALTEALIIDPVGQYGRAPLHRDAIEDQMIRGTWNAPTDGATCTAPDGTEHTWHRVQARDDGWFNDAALNGGYAFWDFAPPSDGIMILTARGPAATCVNGVWRVGDIYQTGWTHIPIPLHQGSNALLFHVARGGLKASLRPPTGPIEFNTSEATLPTLVVGEAFDTFGAVVLINATNDWQYGLALAADCEALGMHTKRAVPAMPPCSIRKVAFGIQGEAPDGPNSAEIALTVAAADTQTLATTTIPIRIVTTNDVIVRTFISDIDGSVQYYGVRLAKEGDDAPELHQEPKAIILSLHGANVEAAHQASCYTPKSWAHLVTPTNRRPFGFDWEDWGRLDAMEVLDHAQASLGADPKRVIVTGHSMGGHGTWQLAATFPGTFVAAAPSAGWVSFWSYAGAASFDEQNPIENLLARATSPSRTLDLIRNLEGLGVYVLHGDADDNVPVEQARTMRSELATFHTDFAYHEEPGAGHWWGNQCMDYPALMAFAEEHTHRSEAPPNHVAFITANPGVSAQRDWAIIAAQHAALKDSAVTLQYDRDNHVLTGTTENVGRLGIDTTILGDTPKQLRIDDGAFDIDDHTSIENGVIWLERTDSGEQSGWGLDAAPPAREKNPQRSGPFKDAFRHNMLFVVGTNGTPDENAIALNKARYDAETFWYRGNGSIDIVLDTDFDPARDPDRNIILYGNKDTNRAWLTLLSDSPVQVSNGSIAVGNKQVNANDLACIMIRPRPGSDTASVGVIAGTSAGGLRATMRLPVFVSGVAYPDLMIWSADALRTGTDAIRVTGFFGSDWSIDHGELAWKAE